LTFRRGGRLSRLLLTRTLLACTLLGGSLVLAGANRVYQVQAGDTLYSIARQAGTSVQALLTLNGLSGPTLRVGQALQVPGVQSAGAAPVARSVPPVPVQALARTVAQPATPQPLATRPTEVFQSGMAVYYGGRADARTPLTAAHLSLPFGTWVEVTHARTGRSVLVMINDRGPFGRSDRVIDLSAAAARVLGIMGEGVAPVTLRVARTP